MTVIYPSARVRLQMRLEEFAATAQLDASLLNNPSGAAPRDVLPTTSAGRLAALTQVQNEITQLIRQRELLSREEYADRKSRLEDQRTRLQQAPAPAEQTQPGSLEGTDPDDIVVIGYVQPLEAEIQRNGLRSADEFRLKLDARDLPIDPRALRACGVVIDIGTVEPRDFAAGNTGERDVNGTLLSQVDVDFGDTATQLYGWVDEARVAYSESGDTVLLSGRDMTSLLLDTPLASQDRIDLSLPIRLGVERLINSYPALRGMKVVYGTPGAPEGGNGPRPSDTMPRTRKARRGKRAARAKSAQDKMKVWDHITDVTVAMGLVPVVRGLVIYLMKPRTFYTETGTVHTVVYGRNIADLEFVRKLGGVKAPTVEVRCYDSDLGATRWARAPRVPGVAASGIFPQDPPPQGGRRANQVEPSGVASDRITTFVVTGVNDGKALEEAADAIFQQIGRQEIQGRFTTRNITSAGNGAVVGDLLRLESGATVEVVTSRGTPVESGQLQQSSYQELREQTLSRRTEYLRLRGWTQEAAQKLASVNSEADDQLTALFRVSDARIKFSQESGIDIEVSFQNYLVIREDANEQAPQQASASAAALAGTRNDAASDSLLAASTSANSVNAAAEAGQLSPEQYAADGAAADAAAKQAVQDRRAT